MTGEDLLRADVSPVDLLRAEQEDTVQQAFVQHWQCYDLFASHVKLILRINFSYGGNRPLPTAILLFFPDDALQGSQMCRLISIYHPSGWFLSQKCALINVVGASSPFSPFWSKHWNLSNLLSKICRKYFENFIPYLGRGAICLALGLHFSECLTDLNQSQRSLMNINQLTSVWYKVL